jgi:chaperonin GroES
MKVLGDRILLKPLKLEERTAGGIILPETAQTYTLNGLVLEIGDEVTKVKKGQTVLYAKYEARAPINGEPCLIVKMSDVLVIVD